MNENTMPGHEPWPPGDGRWHPYGRTLGEDQALLDAGFETGWWGEDGAPAPWPQDFLDPEAGWVGSEGRAVDFFGAGPCQDAEQKTFAQLIAEHEGDEPPF